MPEHQSVAGVLDRGVDAHALDDLDWTPECESEGCGRRAMGALCATCCGASLVSCLWHVGVAIREWDTADWATTYWECDECGDVTWDWAPFWEAYEWRPL